jgi:hypothetical protein
LTIRLCKTHGFQIVGYIRKNANEINNLFADMGDTYRWTKETQGIHEGTALSNPLLEEDVCGHYLREERVSARFLCTIPSKGFA